MHPDVETAIPVIADDQRSAQSWSRLSTQLAKSGATVEVAADYNKSGVHLDVAISADTLLGCLRVLRAEHYSLECLLGLDRKTHLEIVYLLGSSRELCRVRLRATVPIDHLEFPSCCGVFQGADWYEREVHDMFGIVFTDHPHLLPLLLPPRMTIHPLRKDFHGAEFTMEAEDVDQETFDEEANIDVANNRRDFFLNLGPQHPSTHGVLRILLHAEGEQVLGGRCHLGYSHRGTEKAAEHKQYAQFLPYTDRMDYLAPLNYNWGYAKLLERATGIESTPRAEAIRLVMGELGRIASHLVWLGTFLLDLGAVTPFLYCFEDREQLLSIFESVTGQRMTTSYIVVGGVRNDVPGTFAKAVSDCVRQLRKRMPEYQNLIMGNDIFLRRTMNVGNITDDDVRAFGVGGPCARGSGVSDDLRASEPYCALYADLGFTPQVETAGDCLARSKVRVRELAHSLDLIERALDRLVEGPVRSKIPRNLKMPEGEYYSATEGPRGAVGWYLVSDGGATPYRLKVRVPSFANLHVVEKILPGHRIADVVAILGSMDIVVPEIDR